VESASGSGGGGWCDGGCETTVFSSGASCFIGRAKSSWAKSGGGRGASRGRGTQTMYRVVNVAEFVC